jgi:hypothetical protein
MPDTYMPAAARTIFADRLAPCPFCGGEAEILSASSEGPDAGAMFVQCGNGLCMASSALIFALMDDVKPLLRERWNRRAAYAREFGPAEWRPIATAPAPTKPEFNWPTPEEFDKDQS